jgi:outer membrane protein, multidrug efflux system
LRPTVRSALLLAAIASTTACAVGPEYRRPAADTPPAWMPEAPWQQALPADASLKGNWWELFQDAPLSALIDRALGANQSLKVSAARFEQAQDQLATARADLFPTIDLTAAAARTKTSANRPLSAYGTVNQSTTQNDFKIGPSVSYELDLFGRVRRQVEGARATEQEAAANFENQRLVLIAALASNYFALREIDSEIEVLKHSLELQGDALKFVQSRHDLGFATGLELAQQQALLDTSATQLELLNNQRAQLEHAIATLVGAPAPLFTLPASAQSSPLPSLPVGLPADLLQRRPDVAAAEREMAAANARIGVAKAAYFPNIQLLPGIGAPGIGWESSTLATLFDAPGRMWSIGLSAAQTVFDAGRTSANVRFARADYTAAVAGYRQTVLSAMEEVENGITGLTILERANNQAQASVRSAQRAYDLASDRYKGGVDTYLDVITAQQTLLNNQRQAAQIQGQQFATAVYLIKALGGGWQG